LLYDAPNFRQVPADCGLSANSRPPPAPRDPPREKWNPYARVASAPVFLRKRFICCFYDFILE
jgi:hypothetical protein